MSHAPGLNFAEPESPFLPYTDLDPEDRGFYDPTNPQRFSNADIEEFDLVCAEMDAESDSLALAHVSGAELDAEIAETLGEAAIGPVALEFIESLEDKLGAVFALADLDEESSDGPPDDDPDSAVPGLALV